MTAPVSIPSHFNVLLLVSCEQDADIQNVERYVVHTKQHSHFKSLMVQALRSLVFDYAIDSIH